MNQHTTGLGNRRIEQVGADSRGRVDAEPQQDRRHQRSAANSGHPDNEPDKQACNYKSNVTEVHCHTLPNQRDDLKKLAAA
ncbi:hypothetical protein D3C84_608170 [compost metagenome]